MTTPRNGYILSYNPKSYIEEKLIYKAPNDITYISQTNKTAGCHFLCFTRSKAEDSRFQCGYEIMFKKEIDQNTFELALKNNDAKTALSILNQIDPIDYGTVIKAFSPVHYFLQKYVEFQEKEAKQNQSLFAKCGFHQKPQVYTHHSVCELTDPKLAVPQFSFGNL